MKAMNAQGQAITTNLGKKFLPFHLIEFEFLQSSSSSSQALILLGGVG